MLVVPLQDRNRGQKARSGPTIDDRLARCVRSDECVRFRHRRVNDLSSHLHGSAKINARFRARKRPSRKRQIVEQVDHDEMETYAVRWQDRQRQDVGSRRGDKNIC